MLLLHEPATSQQHIHIGYKNYENWTAQQKDLQMYTRTNGAYNVIKDETAPNKLAGE